MRKCMKCLIKRAEALFVKLGSKDLFWVKLGLVTLMLLALSSCSWLKFWLIFRSFFLLSYQSNNKKWKEGKVNRHERWDKWIRKRVLFHLHDKKNWHTLSLQFQFLATQRMCNSQKFTSIFTNTIFNYQSLSHFSNIELQFYNTFTILTFNAIWQMGLSHDMWICV